MSVLIPHFAIPFRIVGTTAAVVEQDTDEEITACVQAIARTTVGTRLELPGFGVPDQTFVQGSADPAVVEQAVQKWEPRAIAAAEAANESLARFVSGIVLDVTGGDQ